MITPFYESADGSIKLFLGKCEDVLTGWEADSFSAVVGDPPYELGFMGKSWDASGIAYSVPMWREVLRVCRPGAHILSFGGTRTYHRMVCAIEDAGFGIRDQLQWLYGSGFPKALDAAKAIDKELGAEREVIGKNPTWREAKRNNVIMEPVRGGGAEVLTATSSDEAKQWEGFKSALKPACEPICLARKPLSEKNIAKNLLRWGTGCLNIDGCRIEGQMDGVWGTSNATVNRDRKFNASPDMGGYKSSPHDLGRYPSNVIIDEQVAAELDAANPQTTSSGGKSGHDGAYSGGWREDHYGDTKPGLGDRGGPSRYFYCAKASKSERNAGLDHLQPQVKVFNGQSAEPSKDMKDVEQRFTTQPSPNSHPTVKPIKLMRYLCRLVTPPGGIILDPFCGSGSTLVAAVHEGFSAVGIDMDPHYLEIAAGRIEHAFKERGKIEPPRKAASRSIEQVTDSEQGRLAL